ncbi:hypothetical protein JTB14_037439 [Gonioctena quinquepunctata]|nr:hypothetical protein JTB14_037439 [Gonioctena quinquepunctata]
MFSYNQLCDEVFEICKRRKITRENCIAASNDTYIIGICQDLDEDYFKWEAPGILRNVLFSCITGLILFIILLVIEYRVCSGICQYSSKKRPVDVPNEDSDVRVEKQKIRNATEMDNKTSHVLALRDLTKYYKKQLVVNGLCLGLKENECIVLLGEHGAGKTTIFKMMTGDVTISYGDGWVNSSRIKTQLRSAQKSIGYCPQTDALLDNMTAEEVIIILSLLRGLRWKAASRLARSLALEFDFRTDLKKEVRQLSHVKKRKLSMAISLIGDPAVLFLDEPFTGMDPSTKQFILDDLRDILDNGKCIVITSLSVEECEAICTRFAIIVNGNLQCMGSPQHLKDKFTEGYTLTIKIFGPPEHSSIQYYDTGPVERFIAENIPMAQIRKKHEQLLIYYIADKSMLLSRMFGILEAGKQRALNIEDYSLGQISLEQMFLISILSQNRTEPGK